MTRFAKTISTNFLNKEDGNIATFSVLLFSLMVMVGGLAVDLMRVEQTRTNLQQTLDRCTLAATALTQNLDPEAVCRDYIVKAGLAAIPTNVVVTQNDGARTVRASARGEQNNFFAPMIGYNTFPVPATSAAEQRITNVEIVLVLDVSGSMSGAKIANLKTAAKNFIDTVLADNSNNRMSVSIVPYNAQVNLPDYLIAKYNATGPALVANANCVELPPAVFATTGISRTLPLPRSVYADTFTRANLTNGYQASNDANWNPGATNAFEFCNARNGNPVSGALTQNLITPASGDATQLKAKIDALYAGGNTSITLGMKWGLAMIDPGTRSVFSELASEGRLPAAFNDRPFDYDDPDTMKVIVLMTDGEHVAHTIVGGAYRDTATPSGIWRGTDGNYSIRHLTGRPVAAGTNEYWVPHRNEWRAQAWTGNTANTGTPVALSWPEVWQAQRTSWVAWQLYARALGTSSTTRTTTYNTWMDNFMDVYATADAMDTSLQASCNLARTNDVIVYGIAFEAPDTGQTQIRNCSSTPQNYYEANGPTIAAAFDSIAAQISQLRLTQ
jgi:Putative Flp pilus-assembly TadE/G-like